MWSSAGTVRLQPGAAPPVVTDDPMRRNGRHAMAGRVLPRLPDQPRDRYRTVDRHPLASVGSLVLGLRCSLCPGSAPMLVRVGSCSGMGQASAGDREGATNQVLRATREQQRCAKLEMPV